MIRKTGSRFNPYGRWTEGHAVWVLLKDCDDEARRGVIAECVIPHSEDVAGEIVHFFSLSPDMFEGVS